MDKLINRYWELKREIWNTHPIYFSKINKLLREYEEVKAKIPMYSVTYSTKKGGSGCMTTTDFEKVKAKLISQYKSKCAATAYHNAEIIGRVWSDNSQRTGWNWSLIKS